MIPGRERRIPQPDRIVRDDAPVVRIEGAVEPGAAIRIADGNLGMAECRFRRLEDHLPHVAIREDRIDRGHLRLEPPGPAMTAGIRATLARELLVVPVLAPSDSLEV